MGGLWDALVAKRCCAENGLSCSLTGFRLRLAAYFVSLDHGVFGQCLNDDSTGGWAMGVPGDASW